MAETKETAKKPTAKKPTAKKAAEKKEPEKKTAAKKTAVKKTEDEKKLLTYKEKPMIRKGDYIFYGNPTDKYIVCFQLGEFRKENGIEVAGHVDIFLQENATYMNVKNKLIKKAERSNLWDAIDIGSFWLEDALKRG